MNNPSNIETETSGFHEISEGRIQEISSKTYFVNSGLTELKETINSIKNEISNDQIERELNKIKNTVEGEQIPQKIQTINTELDGTMHPVTKIPYETKVVLNGNGEKVIGVFPNFSEHSKFETKLPDTLHKESDLQHKDYCNAELKKAYELNQIDTDKLTDRQIEQIKNGDQPEGYDWHHNEEKGKMELVASDIHGRTGHTGGRTIWGGGKIAR